MALFQPFDPKDPESPTMAFSGADLFLTQPTIPGAVKLANGPSLPNATQTNNLAVIGNPERLSWGSLSGSEIKALRDACFADQRLFVEVFFRDLFWGEMSDMHRDFCEMERVPDQRGLMLVTAAPRGHAKTTFRAKIKPIHAILYGYENFILLIGFSGREVGDKTRDIRDQLLYNERLIEVYGRRLSKRSGTTDFRAKAGLKRDDVCRVLARSTGGQVRGLRFGRYRPTRIILDDILSAERVNTPEQREKTKSWFQKDVMGSRETQKTEGGLSITNVDLVGTCMNKDDLLMELLKTPGWVRKHYKAMIREADNQELWAKWRDIYTDLDDEGAVDKAFAFYKRNEADMLRGSEVLWAAGDDYYALQVFIIQNGLAAFNSEKQNDPHDPTRQVLFPERCKKFKVIWPGDSLWPSTFDPEGFCYRMGNDLQHSRNFERVILFHDPALAHQKKSDYAALVVLAQDLNRYIYVLEAWVEKQPYGRQITTALDMADKWGADTIYMEDVAFQELMKVPYQQHITKRGGGPKVIGVHSHKNKHARIARLEPYINNNAMRLEVNLSPRLIEQLREFPMGNDDGPDALEQGVAQLRQPRSISVYREGMVEA